MKFHPFIFGCFTTQAMPPQLLVVAGGTQWKSLVNLKGSDRIVKNNDFCEGLPNKDLFLVSQILAN